jgi:hypothetical protein
VGVKDIKWGDGLEVRVKNTGKQEYCFGGQAGFDLCVREQRDP